MIAGYYYHLLKIYLKVLLVILSSVYGRYTFIDFTASFKRNHFNSAFKHAHKPLIKHQVMTVSAYHSYWFKCTSSYPVLETFLPALTIARNLWSRGEKTKICSNVCTFTYRSVLVITTHSLFLPSQWLLSQFLATNVVSSGPQEKVGHSQNIKESNSRLLGLLPCIKDNRGQTPNEPNVLKWR